MKYELPVGIEDDLDPSQKKKMKRLQAVIGLLRSEKEIEVKKLCGLLCSMFGLRRLTLMEYLTDLMDYGVIEISDGKIMWLDEEPEEGDSP